MEFIKKYLVPIVVIMVGGFVLFGVAFFADFAFQSVIRRLVRLEFPLHIPFAVLVLVISYFILKSSKLPDLLKATYFCVPAMVTLLITYISLYNWPVAAYVADVVVAGLLLFYLIRTKRSWIFYYALSYVLVLVIAIRILGIDI